MSQPLNDLQWNPDYNPDTWSLGYQGRQFGVYNSLAESGASGDVLHALADPPQEMVDASEVISDWNEAPPSNP